MRNRGWRTAGFCDRATHGREKLAKLKIYAHACPNARSTEGENEGSSERVQREEERTRVTEGKDAA